MPLTRVACPSCSAGLKSATGFAQGQNIRCPKCQTAFTVIEPIEAFEEDGEDATPTRPVAKKAAAPAKKRKPIAAVIDDDDEEDDRPARDRKKKKKKGSSYKNSPVRFVILGVLLIVLGAMGYLLYEKKQNERQPVKATTSTTAD